MKLIVPQDQLVELTKNVMPTVVKPGPGEPQTFSCIHLTAENDLLSFFTGNKQADLQGHISAQVVQPGSVGISAKLFLDLVTALPPGEVRLSLVGGRLKVQSGRKILHLNTVDGDSFILPMSDREELIEVSGFYSAVEKVIHCVNKDGTNALFKNILIRNNYMAATDGRRMAVFPFHWGITDEVVIPYEWISKFNKVFSEETFKLGLSVNCLKFASGNIKGSIRLLSKPFPAIERAFPTGAYDEATVPKEEFLNTLKVAKTVSNESMNIVKLNFSKESLHIEAETQLGKVEDTISCSFYKDFTSNYNLDFLIDAVKKIEGDTLVFHLRVKEMPLVLKEGEYVQLMMPIK